MYTYIYIHIQFTLQQHMHIVTKYFRSKYSLLREHTVTHWTHWPNATHYNALQHTVTHPQKITASAPAGSWRIGFVLCTFFWGNTLQHTEHNYTLQRATIHCNAPTEKHCNTVNTITHYNTLQHTATHPQKNTATQWTQLHITKRYNTLQCTHRKILQYHLRDRVE